MLAKIWSYWPSYTFAFAILYLSFHIIRSYRYPVSRLPGPLYSKLTGFWLIIHEFVGNRRLYIHNLHKRHGPVVCLGPNEVSFTGLDAIKEIYLDGGSGYDKTELYTLFMQFGFRTMFSTLVKGDPEKRYIAGQYANTNIMGYEIMDGIRERSAKFLEKCTESVGKSVDVYVYLHCFSLDCTSHFLFHPYGTQSLEGGEDRKIMEELSYHNSLQIRLIQYRFMRIVDFLLKVANSRPTPVSQEYVFRTCANLDASPNSLLHKLQNSRANFRPTEIAAECMDHMAAGHDTLGDALCFLMYHISLPGNQDVQNKLSQELIKNKDVPLEELKYLDAVVKEGLRYFPPHSNVSTTVLSCQAYSVHRLNEEIYPDGNKFNPDRWLDPEMNLDMNRAFFAFSIGGRGCTGKHLAMLVMKYLLGAVYSQCRTRIADDMKGRMDIADQIVSSRPLDQTCKLVFEPR
ncbi:cytochrome P450 [Bisporella sp. PMI_857]|nr:cytochrome P450 [Bisporella sp. PMI_857]